MGSVRVAGETGPNSNAPPVDPEGAFFVFDLTAEANAENQVRNEGRER